MSEEGSRSVPLAMRPAGFAGHLPWPDASHDAAVALHCFQFWPDPLAGLREVHRVLRPGGRRVLILREHARRGAPSWLPNPVSRSADELAGVRLCLMEAGFSVREETGDRLLPAHAVVACRP